MQQLHQVGLGRVVVALVALALVGVWLALAAAAYLPTGQALQRALGLNLQTVGQMMMWMLPLMLLLLVSTIGHDILHPLGVGVWYRYAYERHTL